MTVLLAASVMLAGSACVPVRGTPVASEEAGGPAMRGSEETLRALAATYIDAVNRRDAVMATTLTCSGHGPGTLFEVASSDEDSQWLMRDDVTVLDGERGVVRIAVVGGNQSSVPTPFRFTGERWCVAV